MSTTPSPEPLVWSGYQRFVALLLAFLQFAVILDFMLMAPLGALIMPALAISPRQFGLAVSAYAFSAGIAGLLTAGFADRFDRKRLLLFFYIGFILATLWCGLAPTFPMLLAARVTTGLFGGVIGSVVMAIATDLFVPQLRGRVMGVIQTAFAASQVLGLPAGLYLSNRWDWHAPFLVMSALGVVGGVVIAWRLRPVTAHLALPQERNPLLHLLNTLTVPRYLIAFATTALLTTGGYMLMPFSTAFMVHNVHIPLSQLPTIYLITGVCTIFVGPLVGRATDAVGRLPIFLIGSTMTITLALIYTHLGPVPFPVVILINVLLFIGIFSRMIPYQALVTSVPEPGKRGSFNAVSAAVQQLTGGCSSLLAGHLVAQAADGRILHFPLIGYTIAGTTVLTAGLVWHIARDQAARSRGAPALASAESAVPPRQTR